MEEITVLIDAVMQELGDLQEDDAYGVETETK